MSMDKGEILKEGIYNSHEPLIHWQLAIISRSSLPFFFFFLCPWQGVGSRACRETSVRRAQRLPHPAPDG